MKIFLTFIVTIFLSTVSISGAQEKPPLIGTGSAQCRSMIDGIDKQNLNKEVYEQWVFGFMSSLALVHSQPVFDLSKPEEIWLAVETICKKNPGGNANVGLPGQKHMQRDWDISSLLKPGTL